MHQSVKSRNKKHVTVTLRFFSFNITKLISYHQNTVLPFQRITCIIKHIDVIIALFYCLFCVMFVVPPQAFHETVDHSPGVLLWKEMFRGFSICHIKAETAIGVALPPALNFPSPQHTVVPPFVGKSSGVFPVHCEV